MAVPLSERRTLAMPGGLAGEARMEWLRKAQRMRELAEQVRAKEASAQGFVYRRRGENYWADPVAWAHDCVIWPEGRGLVGYQEEILSSLVEHKRAAVRGPHGLGKTSVAAIAILWFAITRDAAGADWKCPTTASAWRQLEDYLWPEIHKWARLLRWDVIGREPFNPRTELLKLNLKLSTGAAFALASDDPASMEGAHADELFYLFDESKTIPAATFDAAEGAFSTAGTEHGTNAYALSVSTPGEPIGRFYEIHARRPGTEDWWVRHVTKTEAIAAGRVTAEWADQRAALWGRESAVYQNRVEGEFASSSEDGVIPLAWVELANDRWRALYEPDGEQTGKFRPPELGTRAVLAHGDKLHTLGVDVARGGEDKTVLALRRGNTIVELRRYSHTEDSLITAAYVEAVQEGHGDPKAIVDVIGPGSGVYDQVRAAERPCLPFNSSEGTKRHDLTGEFGFTNKRSWGWWNLREMLDPNNGCDVGLPPDDRLTGDLVAPKWRVMSGGRIQIESKDDIKKRIGRSTDDGDSVVYAMSDSGGSWADLYREAPAEEEGVPAPRQKPSRSGGWANVYKTKGKDGEEKPADGAAPAPAAPAAPTRSGGYFGPQPNAGPTTSSPSLEPRVLAKPCRCGNTRGEHAGDQHDGPCTDPECPCTGFTAPL